MKQLRPFFPECYRAIANGKGTVKIDHITIKHHNFSFWSFDHSIVLIPFIALSVMEADGKHFLFVWRLLHGLNLSAYIVRKHTSIPGTTFSIVV